MTSVNKGNASNTVKWKDSTLSIKDKFKLWRKKMDSNTSVKSLCECHIGFTTVYNIWKTIRVRVYRFIFIERERESECVYKEREREKQT